MAVRLIWTLQSCKVLLLICVHFQLRINVYNCKCVLCKKNLLSQARWKTNKQTKNSREFCGNPWPQALPLTTHMHAHPAPPNSHILCTCPSSMHSHFTNTAIQQLLDTPTPSTYSSSDPPPPVLCCHWCLNFLLSFSSQNFTLHSDSLGEGLLVKVTFV